MICSLVALLSVAPSEGTAAVESLASRIESFRVAEASSWTRLAPPIPLEEEEVKKDAHLRLGRFTYWMIAGIEFSQDDGEFSEINPYIQFTGDTSWRPDPLWETTLDDRITDWSDLHTSFDLTLGSTSAIVEGAGAPMGEEFLRSKKALSLALTLEWRTLKMPWDPKWAPNSDENPDLNQVLYVGPILRGGFHTLTDRPEPDEDIDTVNSWIAGGIRIGSFEQRPLDFNPPLLRRVDLTWGYHENYDDERLMIDALLRTDPSTGFFLAAQAVVGPGEDDVRVMAGISLNLRGVQTAVGSFAGIFGGSS